MSGALLLAGAKVGEYEIAEKLAEGGMGIVYAAVHPVIGKRAAIKVMSATLCADDEAASRFVQEARAVNHIGHPNIVDIFSIGELVDGRSYFVMEWLPGESLGKRLERGALSIADAVAIIDQIADAVSAAHAAGIVHRDLKPDNVMLVDRGDRSTVKLLDFGIAKLADPDGRGYVAHTKTGLVMGTPGYMSPEQARGKHVDHRTDIYSLGCIAYELLTGKLPFNADNSMDVVIQHVQDPIPRVAASREVPASLDELVAAMMAKSADQRPTLAAIRESVADVALSLEATSEFASAHFARLVTPAPLSRADTHAAEPVTNEQRPVRRRGALMAAIAGVAVVAVGVFALANRGGAKDAAKSEVASPEMPAAAPQNPEAKSGSAEAEVVPPARLRIVAPEGSVVSLDDTVIGETGGEVVAEEIAPGKHLLAVRQLGFVAYSQWIEVGSGDDLEVPVVLKPEIKTETPPTSEDARGVSAKKRKAPSGKKDNAAAAKHNGTPGKSPVPQVEKAKSGAAASESKKPSDKDYTLDPFAR